MDAKELEEKSTDVLKELLDKLPDKVEGKKQSKGVVQENQEIDKKEKQYFDVTEAGDLTLSHEGWTKEFFDLTNDDWINKEVKWMSN